MELAEYTTLAMFQCQSDMEVETIQSLLHPIIVGAVEAGDVATRDWSKVAIPSLPRAESQDLEVEGRSKRSIPSDFPADDGPAPRPRLEPPTAFAHIGVVELGNGLGQLLVAARELGAKPLALLGTPNKKMDGAVAHLLGDNCSKYAVEKGLEVLDPSQVDVVLVSCRVSTVQGADQEVRLLCDELPNVIQRLHPSIVVVVREEGLVKTEISTLDELLHKQGYKRVLTEESGGFLFGSGVERAGNLYLKGGFAQLRDILHYELVEVSDRLGPLVSLQADHQKPKKRLRDVLIPVDTVPAHAWLNSGCFTPTDRSQLQEEGPVGQLMLGGPDSTIGAASRVLFSKSEQPWIVARVLEDKLVLHRESGWATSTVRISNPVHAYHQVPRDISVFSIHGTAPSMQLSAAGPLGPPNMLIWDDRSDPGQRRLRSLTENELMRLVGVLVTAKEYMSGLPIERRLRIWAASVPEEIAYAVAQRALLRAAAAGAAVSN